MTLAAFYILVPKYPIFVIIRFKIFSNFCIFFSLIHGLFGRESLNLKHLGICLIVVLLMMSRLISLLSKNRFYIIHSLGIIEPSLMTHHIINFGRCSLCILKSTCILQLLYAAFNLHRLGQISLLWCQIFHIPFSFCLTLLSFTERGSLKSTRLWNWIFSAFGAMSLGPSNLRWFYLSG